MVASPSVILQGGESNFLGLVKKLALQSTGNYDLTFRFSSAQTCWINVLGVEAWPTGVGSFLKDGQSGFKGENSSK